MGKPLVRIRLWNLFQDADVQAGRVAPLEREALADTGAMYVMLPKQLADHLGLLSAGTRRIRYADGRIEEKPLVRGLVIEAEGRTADCRAIVEDNGPQLLIGQLALEDLDLYVDCPGRRLVPRAESPDMPMAEQY